MRSRDMRIGAVFPQTEIGADPGAVRAYAQAVEGMGFSHILAYDHVLGADIATLVPQALARLTAWIGQRPVLFAGSLRDNIRFARPEASDAEVAEAARAAPVHGLAASLPPRLDSHVGAGAYRQSGGQGQRVASARAFLKHAPQLLHSEPPDRVDLAPDS